jgi:hypothetical protein
VNSTEKNRFVKKSCWLLFVCFTAAGASIAQESLSAVAPPNIEILKLHSDREVRLPRNFDPAVIPTGNTFSDPATRSSAPTTTAAADAPRGSGAIGNRASPSPANPNVTFPATPGQLPIFYVYSLKIRNVGPKVIEGLAWDYLLIDQNSKAELGRHQFLSYAKAPTNKSIQLRGQLRSSPVRVVAASGQKTRPRFIEKAVIECVLYADDTVWRNPHASDGVCESLKENKPVKKQKHRAVT